MSQQNGSNQYWDVKLDAHPWKIRFHGRTHTDNEQPTGMDGGQIISTGARMLLEVLEVGEFLNVLTGYAGDLPSGVYALTEDGLFRVITAEAA